jgi:hypothetical protein
VVRSRSYQANLHLILGIPPGKLVNHKKAFTRVQEVNGSLLICVKSLHGHGNIDVAPVDCIACLIIKDNSFVLGRTTCAETTGTTESTRLGDCGLEHGGVRGGEVLWLKGVFVTLGDRGVVDDVLVGDSDIEQKFLAFLSGSGEESLGQPFDLAEISLLC